MTLDRYPKPDSCADDENRWVPSSRAITIIATMETVKRLVNLFEGLRTAVLIVGVNAVATDGPRQFRVSRNVRATVEKSPLN